MAALLRYGLRKCHNLGQQFSASPLHHKYLKGQLCLPLVQTARCVADAQESRRFSIKIRNRLDHNLGISTELFNAYLSSTEKQGLATEQDLNLLLHICSIGPYDSPSRDRIQYANRIWSKFEESSVQLTSKLFNMKLKAYCANDERFSPLDELATMKSLGINPDKVTYGYLIEGFCRNGDMPGANHVLEAMDDAHLLIEVSAFNSFITGHLKAGSPEEASQVLETLRSRGLTPNSDTFFRFIQHFAEEGDLTAVLKYIDDAKSAGLPVDQNTLMKVYRLMLQKGHENQASQILPMVIEKDVLSVGTMSNICQLIADGFHKEALNIYLSIPSVTEIISDSAGMPLLKSMILNNLDVKDILEAADRLSEAHPKTNPHSMALFQIYKAQKHEAAVKMIEEMLTLKQDVRIPHILPALCRYRDAGNMEGVYKTIDMMLSVDPCEDTLDALQTFAYPALKQMGQSNEDILTKMKEHATKWNTFFMIKELRESGCVAALESVSQKSLNNGFVALINFWLLIDRMPKEKEACVKLIAKLIKENKLKKQIALTIIRNSQRVGGQETICYMLDMFKEEGIKFPSSFLGYLDVLQAPQEIHEKVKQLCEYEPISWGVSFEALNAKTREELDDYIKKYPKHTLARFASLKKAMISKDLPEIHERLRDLTARDISMSKFHLTSVIYTLLDLDDVETASAYFKELQERFGNKYVDTLPLYIAAKHVKAGNIQDALEMIEAAKNNEALTQGKPNARKLHISSLLSSAKTMNEVESIHEALVKGKRFLAEDDSKFAHYHYILKALESDNDDDLLQRVTQIRDQYWVFPCIDKVITRFIEKQDVEYLKKVMDLGVSVVGNNMFQHKLACNFIGCGMPSKAAAVFMKMGDTLSSRLLESNCKYFIKANQIHHIESLVEIVKELPVSRAFMLKQLIDAYVKNDNLEKVAEVLQIYDDEFLVPHKSSLDFLESYYKKHKIEQPSILKKFLPGRENFDTSKPQATSDIEGEQNEKEESQQHPPSDYTDIKTA